MFPILNPPPSSLPISSLWVVPVHQPQASSIVHQTWTGNLFHAWYFTCFNAILPNLPTLSLSHRLHKTLESPLDCKEIQPVHPKGDQSWVFIGRTDAEAETPILWPPPAKSWLIGKDPDAGRDWGQEENGMTEDEIAGWHHWLDGHEFEWTPGVGDGQGGLVSCDSWGRKELDTIERLNWTELSLISLVL